MPAVKVMVSGRKLLPVNITSIAVCVAAGVGVGVVVVGVGVVVGVVPAPMVAARSWNQSCGVVSVVVTSVVIVCVCG